MIEQWMMRSSLTANEECVAGEHSAVVTIFEQEADAVLGVAWCVQGFYFDVLADGESLTVAGSLGDLLTVFTADDGQRVALEDFDVASGMVVVAGHQSDQPIMARASRVTYW
jgi:hypothetical protein